MAVHPYDTVASLKARLHPLLGATEENGAATKLYHNGAELGAKPGEDALPLSEFGVDPAFSVVYADANVQPNDTVYLDPKQFNVGVRGPDRKIFPLKMTPADNINTLRKKLGKVQGIPPEELRFVCDSTALGSDPRTTLDDYGVQPFFIIWRIFLRGICPSRTCIKKSRSLSLRLLMMSNVKRE